MPYREPDYKGPICQYCFGKPGYFDPVLGQVCKECERAITEGGDEPESCDPAMTTSAPRVRKHEGGLRVQELTGPEMPTRQHHEVAIPPCCPVSGNPMQGSLLTLSYAPKGWVIEVYSLPQVLQRFVGGWKGTDSYPAERNMEGMIRLLGQMSADALGVRVRLRAYLVLDAGQQHVNVNASPRAL